MVSLDFIPNNLIAAYLITCWGVDPSLLVVDNPSYYNVTLAVANLDTSGSIHWQVVQESGNYGVPLVVDINLLSLLNAAVHEVLIEFSGFCAFAVVFGLSLAASILSLLYLFKNWRNNASHMVVTGFTLLISASNIAVFVLRALTIAGNITNTVCPTLSGVSGPRFAFTLVSLLAFLGLPSDPEYIGATIGLSLTLIPAFLWITDTFLLYRAWVIWVYHRKYTAVPALVLLASFVAGVIWLQRAVAGINDYGGILSVKFNAPERDFELNQAVFQWIPALGFSCALDALTTGMIASRLIYHHGKQSEPTEGRSTMIYLPIIAIFVESAALSLISKILQLSCRSLSGNPIVVPLCTISSNLIVLRKALGADAGDIMARVNQDLSSLSFRRPDSQPAASDGIPNGFESHLIRTIGGHIVDFGPLGQAETLVPQIET